MFVNYILMFFIGYMVGRIGHIYGGDLSGPHHWVYGLLLFLPSIFFHSFIVYLILFLGVGLFVSDLKDFIEFKVWGRDDVKIKKFWGID